MASKLDSLALSTALKMLVMRDSLSLLQLPADSWRWWCCCSSSSSSSSSSATTAQGHLINTRDTHLTQRLPTTRTTNHEPRTPNTNHQPPTTNNSQPPDTPPPLQRLPASFISCLVTASRQSCHSLPHRNFYVCLCLTLPPPSFSSPLDAPIANPSSPLT
jgi:hypothetical protein